MTLRPGNADLLAVAVETLRTFALPHIGDDRDRDTVLSALRALSIVQANLAHDDGADRSEAVGISLLLGLPADTDPVTAHRELASRIRVRTMPTDRASQVRLLDLLQASAASKLRSINPKYMVGRQRRAESSY